MKSLLLKTFPICAANHPFENKGLIKIRSKLMAVDRVKNIFLAPCEFCGHRIGMPEFFIGKAGLIKRKIERQLRLTGDSR